MIPKLSYLLFIATVTIAPLGTHAAIEGQKKPETKPTEPPKPAPVLTRAPELTTFIHADYPAALLAARQNGEAQLLIDIDAQGAVERVEVQSASHAEFGPAAAHAALQFVFRPAEIDNQPAPIRIEYRYVFEVPIETPVVQEPQEEAPIRLTGLLREAGTRRPIARAAIFIDGALNTQTAEDGTFAIRGVAPGPHKLSIRAPNYEEFRSEEQFAEDAVLKGNYYLITRSLNPFESVVVSQAEQREVAKIQLSRREIAKSPGTFGDPIKVIENLPGLARVPGGLGGALLVRGANPTDTAVFIDGVQVPLLYHFGGLTSIVTPELVERIDFFPGGFSSRYGRATAGVVDVGTRDLDCDGLRGVLDFNVANTYGYACYPVGEWKLAIGGRRSYIDAILPFVLENLPNEEGQGRLTAAPVYWDYQFKAHRKFSAHTVDIFWFGTDDRFKLIRTGSAEDINFKFHIHQAAHTLLLKDRWRLTDRISLASTVAPFFQQNDFAASSSDIDFSNTFDLKIFGLLWREDLSIDITDFLKFNAGIDMAIGQAKVDVFSPAPTELTAFPTPTFDFADSQLFRRTLDVFNHAYWAEAALSPGWGFKLTPGLRVERWDFSQTQDWSILPRVATRWEAYPGTTLKGAWGIFEKLPEPQYIIDSIGNPRLPPERSVHYITGIEQAFTELVNLDLQFFYNKRSHLASPSAAVRYENGRAINENWDDTGTGKTYGMEIMLRHLARPDSRFYGWIAYTLSRSTRRDRQPQASFDATQSNDGSPQNVQNVPPTYREYLSPFDQTHILTIVAQWILPWGFEAGLRFRYVTGNPQTDLLTARVYYDADLDAYQTDTSRVKTNGIRLPAFHQLDIRVDKTFTFDLWKLTTYLELLNSYNRKNVESYRYDYRYSRRVPVTFLPIVPLLGVRGEW